MNLFRPLRAAVLVCFTGAGLSSCLSAPDFPIEPSIDFNKLEVTRRLRSGSVAEVDTLKFVLNFRDGDGDLGLSQADVRTAPYNQPPASTARNHTTNEYNYYIQPFLKNSAGQFVPFVNPGGQIGEYDGTFLRLDGTDAKPAPLKGTLNYKLPLALNGAPFRPGQVLRFEISILDRALHESNTVTTSEVTLGQ